MKQEQIKQQINKNLDNLIVKLVYDENEDLNIDTIDYIYSYSARNRMIGLFDCMVKTGQYPTAYKTYNQWKKIGRNVKKGQKATYFLRPIRITKKIEKEGQEEEKEIKTIFKYYPVFEAHQTEGEPFRKQDLITGDLNFTLSDIIAAISIPVEEKIDGIATGSTDGKTIQLNFNNNENTLISTIFHEMGHYHLHFNENEKVDTKTAELEAEATSYIITKLLGLENEKSRKYILGWAKEEAQELLIKNRSRIFKAVNIILDDIKPIFKGGEN